MLHDSKVEQCIKEATKETDTVFPIPGHPTMRLDTGFIELPMGMGFQASIVPLPEHAAVRAVNCTMDEKRKKEKDDKKARRWTKQRVMLNRGKRR